MANTGVRLENITKIYEDPKTKKDFKAVDDISLSIEPGSFVTLLGPSGCGKTTVLRMIAGFESPDWGDIYLDDTPVNALTPNKRDTAMVFQSYALFPHYNVFDNIAYGLRVRKLGKTEIKERVTAMLDMAELNGLENRMTNQLSGGQQQRVALARTLVLEPGVLLFDEPLSNLDAKLRISMRTEIRRIQRKFGITAVYVTHDQSEAMSIADKIVIMNKGVIAAEGTPKEIYYRPGSEFAADFIGEANFLGGRIVRAGGERCTVSINHSDVEILNPGGFTAGQDCKVMLRPEAARISDEGALPCEVILSCFMGAYQNYHVMVGGTLVKINDFNPVHKKIYQEGERAFLGFSEDAVHLL